MAATDSHTNDGPKLSEIFNNVWKVLEYVESTDDTTVSEKYQVCIWTIIGIDLDLL